MNRSRILAVCQWEKVFVISAAMTVLALILVLPVLLLDDFLKGSQMEWLPTGWVVVAFWVWGGVCMFLHTKPSGNQGSLLRRPVQLGKDPAMTLPFWQFAIGVLFPLGVFMSLVDWQSLANYKIAPSFMLSLGQACAVSCLIVVALKLVRKFVEPDGQAENSCS